MSRWRWLHVSPTNISANQRAAPAGELSRLCSLFVSLTNMSADQLAAQAGERVGASGIHYVKRGW
jgi:hypothetical protein